MNRDSAMAQDMALFLLRVEGLGFRVKDLRCRV